MIQKQYAIDIREQGLKAIELLTEILYWDVRDCSPDQYEQIERGVGISIGVIQTQLLDVLYKEHPDIDNLR